MGEYFAENCIFIIFAISILSFFILKFTSEIIGFTARGVLGVISIFIIDIILSPFNIAVGINFFTGLMSAFLGIPAIVLMFGLALLFR